MDTGSETITITIELKVPKGWEDLDEKQLRYVFGLIAHGFAMQQIKTYCLFRWSGMEVMHKYGNKWWCKHGKKEFLLTTAQVNAAVKSMDWLDNLPATPVRLRRIGKYRAVAADFQEVPFETFIICDNLYQGYLATKQDEILDQMAVHLYGSPNVKPCPKERVCIFYWFASLKEMFARQFKHFFRPVTAENGGNMIGQEKSQYEVLNESVNAQIRALTKGDVTKEKEVLAIDTWRALTELDALAKEYDEFNKKFPSK